jgi:SAM-dependent methyltransferase
MWLQHLLIQRNKSTMQRYYIAALRLFGNFLNVITGDTLVVDRWIWLKRNLPKTRNGEKIIDIGCGSGAFTIEAALRGYSATGLSWDQGNQVKATERANVLGVSDRCAFPVFDARNLCQLPDSAEKYDWVINFENIEHILDDRKLIKDIAALLKPGGHLLMTTPYLNYFPMSREDLGPFESEENGGHVRRGYSEQMLSELCELSGLRIEKLDYCSGIFSQIMTRFLRGLQKVAGREVAWVVIFPFRFISMFFEILNIKGRGYSICMVAYKPRFRAENGC